jgi:hypothetical protein
MTRRNQYQPLEGEEAQASQDTRRSEDLESMITSRISEFLANSGMMNIAARYDGRAGIASRKCLEVPVDHFGYAARLENKSQRTSMEKPMRFQEYSTKHRGKIIDVEQQWMESLCDFCAVSKLDEADAIKFVVNFMDYSHKLMLHNLPEDEYPETLEEVYNKGIVPFLPSVHVPELDKKLRNLKQDPEKDVMEIINSHAKLEEQLMQSSPEDQVKTKCSSSAQCMRLINALHPPFAAFVTKVFETEGRAQDWPTEYPELIPLLTHYWPIYRSHNGEKPGRTYLSEGKRTGAPAFERKKEDRSKAGDQIKESREYFNELPEEKQKEIKEFQSLLKKARAEAKEAGGDLNIDVIKQANELNVCIKCSNAGHLVRACLQHQNKDKRKADQKDQARQKASA